MPTATLTSKGQITIPKPIRDLLHLKSGDRLEFVVASGEHIVLRPSTHDLTALDGLLNRSEHAPVSVAAMHEAVEEAVSQPYEATP